MGEMTDHKNSEIHEPWFIDHRPSQTTTVHNRYHVGCSCCGAVKFVQRKADAKRSMIAHMDTHELSETVDFSVYDSMHRGGPRVVYGGRIFNGARSHGIGVAVDFMSTAPAALAGSNQQ